MPIDFDLRQMTIEQLRVEVLRLRGSIRGHRDEHGHGRCWLDDGHLYQSLPEGFEGHCHLPPREVFLKNCARYWINRQSTPDTNSPTGCSHEVPIKGGTVTLRPCSPADISAIVEIDRANWGPIANSVPLYRQLIELFPSLILVAEDSKNSLAGCCVGLIGSSVTEGWILSIDVAPKKHGRGIGSVLLKSAVDAFSHYEVDGITAIVDTGNRASFEMFTQHDFRVVGEERNYFKPGDSHLRMRRDCMRATC